MLFGFDAVVGDGAVGGGFAPDGGAVHQCGGVDEDALEVEGMVGGDAEITPRQAIPQCTGGDEDGRAADGVGEHRVDMLVSDEADGYRPPIGGEDKIARD